MDYIFDSDGYLDKVINNDVEYKSISNTRYNKLGIEYYVDVVLHKESKTFTYKFKKNGAGKEVLRYI